LAVAAGARHVCMQVALLLLLVATAFPRGWLEALVLLEAEVLDLVVATLKALQINHAVRLKWDPAQVHEAIVEEGDGGMPP
jgi:hypothetical protein